MRSEYEANQALAQRAVDKLNARGWASYYFVRNGSVFVEYPTLEQVFAVPINEAMRRAQVTA